MLELFFTYSTECRVQSTQLRVQSTEYTVKSTEYRVHEVFLGVSTAPIL